MPTLPDIELAVVTRLGTMLGVHAGLDLDDRRPAVTVAVAGGAPDAPGMPDRPRIQVDAWADDWATARTLAYQAADVLTSGITDPGWSAAGVAVTDCRVITRPLRLDDPTSHAPRYSATYLLYARTGA
jgi:hypothetical protein